MDSDYRGEVKIILVNFGKEKFIVQNGLRTSTNGGLSNSASKIRRGK